MLPSAVSPHRSEADLESGKDLRKDGLAGCSLGGTSASPVEVQSEDGPGHKSGSLGVQSGKHSFLQVATQRVFTKQRFEVVEIDSKEKVVVPKEVFQGAKPLWEDFVVRKFPKAPQSTPEARRVLWQEIKDHHDSPLIRNKPWILVDDYNEMLDLCEHSRVDDHPVLTAGMRAFQSFVNYCSLSDMTYHGPLFTWCNKRENDLILKKLDRVLVKSAWELAYPQAYSVFSAGGCSDHVPCQIMVSSGAGVPVKRRKPFKFVNLLRDMDEFLPLVGSYWESTQPLFLSTSSLFRFSKKLKGLKPGLRSLAKRRMGDLVRKTKEAYEMLCQAQQANLGNPSPQEMEAENAAYKKWEFLAGLEEKYLKQKSKLHWLQVGDRNNKAFHRAVKVREAMNTIKEIQCNDGRVVVQADEIKVEAERHFREFLQVIPSTFEGSTVEALETLLPFRCSVADQHALTREVLGKEIKRVLFSMPHDKLPGPDGFTAEFFKSTWGILGADFVFAVQSFFAKGFLPKGLNATILALIPKKVSAVSMKDYRPISCCNVIYKVISKIIANRLKRVLPKFVSSNQSAFVQDRLLIENVLLATEIVKDYHKPSISGKCAIKIDISKAFDSVQWSFLSKVLSAMHFPPTFIQWIMLCVTTASFSVQVNGELAGVFQSSRGLRQGCAISPYFFFISMDVLSKLLDRTAGELLFGYHPRCRNLNLTHLSFADDLLVLSDGKLRSIEGIIKVFAQFEKISGLSISMEKSTLYLAGGATHTLDTAQVPFDMSVLPVRYLGLPLVTKCLTLADCLPLLEQLRKRIGSWTVCHLSFAGRFNLISSVLWSVCNFWMGTYSLPTACLDEINSMCSAFLWSGTEMNTQKAKVSWLSVCRPKAEGGLGLRSLQEANLVSSLKLIWRLVSHGDSLWVKWVNSNLLKQVSFWSVKSTTTLGSWIWKRLLKCRDLAKTFCKVEVGNGEQTSFWYDNWSGLGTLSDVVGERGSLDMGIAWQSTLAEVWENRRRRKHRVDQLNTIEEALHLCWQKRRSCPDRVVWRGRNDIYRPKFSTKDTWNHVRTTSITIAWHRGVWFGHATPKFSFCVWLVALDRLSTGARMVPWNGSSAGMCVFCQNVLETRDHLFFQCPFVSSVWSALAEGLFATHFSNDWLTLLDYLSNPRLELVRGFLSRYMFQAVVYTIWRERNGRRHGEAPQTEVAIISWIDRQVRDRLLSIGLLGDRRFDDALQLWFQSCS